jgi:hypothetical protein
LHIFDFVEGVFIDVTHCIEIGIVRPAITGVALRRADAQCALFCDLQPDHPAAIGFIGDDRERWLFQSRKACIIWLS